MTDRKDLAAQALHKDDDVAGEPSSVEAARDVEPVGEQRTLSPEARRALQEAEARRAEIDRRQKQMPKELGGRGGLDPARYGDWEVKGISSDF